MSLFEIGNNKKNRDTKYNRKVKIPQYEITGIKPLIQELCNPQKTIELMAEISNSGVSEQEKEFLRLAAQRHLLFNYSNIAEYYAHSSKEMQELMEKSALVIIDFDDAIADGYIKLSTRIKKLMEG